jgi:hypothetical protein
VTYAAAPVEQLAHGRLRLRLELRPPVAERLQRDALRLAILPLIQVATLPRLVMRPPERLALPPPSGPIVRHSVLLSLEKRQGEQIVPGLLWNNVSALDAYRYCDIASLIPRPNSLFSSKNSLFLWIGNSVDSTKKISPLWGVRWLDSAATGVISLFFP